MGEGICALYHHHHSCSYVAGCGGGDYSSPCDTELVAALIEAGVVEEIAIEAAVVAGVWRRTVWRLAGVYYGTSRLQKNLQTQRDCVNRTPGDWGGDRGTEGVGDAHNRLEEQEAAV